MNSCFTHCQTTWNQYKKNIQTLAMKLISMYAILVLLITTPIATSTSTIGNFTYFCIWLFIYAYLRLFVKDSFIDKWFQLLQGSEKKSKFFNEDCVLLWLVLGVVNTESKIKIDFCESYFNWGSSCQDKKCNDYCSNVYDKFSWGECVTLYGMVRCHCHWPC